jgi:rSAM/selenodomain-associated transferase 1
MIERTLIVMAKAPRLGQGKTRLARDAGRAEALRINRAMHARTLRVACDARWRAVLAVTPDDATGLALPGIWPKGVARAAQGGGDLGARMARAMDRERGPVAIVGTDCPAMTRADIAAAFAALRHAPVAIGPAEDGGFWVLAARRARDVTPAFTGVRWSTVHAMADVVAGIPASVAMLRTLRDVDTLADWRAARS